MNWFKRAAALGAASLVFGSLALAGAASPAEARTTYWCERTMADAVGIIRCGGSKTPTKKYYVEVSCKFLWFSDVNYVHGPVVTVKSGNGSGAVCKNNRWASAVKAVWVN